ncbi:unnamed protein product [Victoria cruziana]
MLMDFSLLFTEWFLFSQRNGARTTHIVSLLESEGMTTDGHLICEPTFHRIFSLSDKVKSVHADRRKAGGNQRLYSDDILKRFQKSLRFLSSRSR